MLELQLAVALASGLADRDGLVSTWTDGKAKGVPRRVVLVAAEEPVEVICIRLHAILATLHLREVLPESQPMNRVVELLSDNLLVYPLAGRARLSLIDGRLRRTRHMDELEAACSGARLVIVDPLRQVHLQDENRSDAMSALVSLFKALAQSTRAGVVFAHHTSRASDWQGMGDAAGAARGSTALSADVRWQLNLTGVSKAQARQWGLAAEQADRHALLHHAKGNYGAKSRPVLLERLAGGVLMAAKPAQPSATTKAAGKGARADTRSAQGALP
jgi:RecA-family ATPase